MPPLDIGRKLNVCKTSHKLDEDLMYVEFTSYEDLMYVEFTSCVGLLHDFGGGLGLPFYIQKKR